VVPGKVKHRSKGTGQGEGAAEGEGEVSRDKPKRDIETGKIEDGLVCGDGYCRQEIAVFAMTQTQRRVRRSESLTLLTKSAA
jgi:hypothetical protein